MSVTTDLDAIRERADAATTGPWEVDGSEIWAGEKEWIGETSRVVNREFIAHARTDVPFLLDLVDELRRQVKVWKGKAE